MAVAGPVGEAGSAALTLTLGRPKEPFFSSMFQRSLDLIFSLNSRVCIWEEEDRFKASMRPWTGSEYAFRKGLKPEARIEEGDSGVAAWKCDMASVCDGPVCWACN